MERLSNQIMRLTQFSLLSAWVTTFILFYCNCGGFVSTWNNGRENCFQHILVFYDVFILLHICRLWPRVKFNSTLAEKSKTENLMGLFEAEVLVWSKQIQFIYLIRNYHSSSLLGIDLTLPTHQLGLNKFS